MALSRCKILVVDDDQDIREVLRCLLESAGYLVDEACDGMDAAARLNLEAYDLVITDYRMPRLNGLKLLSLCRTVWPDTAVALFSSGEEDPLARRLGAYAWLRKPHDIGKVLEIAEAIDRAAKTRNRAPASQAS